MNQVSPTKEIVSTLSAGVVEKMQQSETAFKNNMHKLLSQEFNEPVPLSLMEYIGNVMDIELLLNMTDNEIDIPCHLV